MKQIDKSEYVFDKYVYFDRWASYYYQIREVIKLRPETMLEIGVGDGVLKEYIKNNTAIHYSNVDIAEDLQPDIIGSIEALPSKDNSYDMIVAFEVLEHVPFEKFEHCLQELNRVSKKQVLISLPHFGPAIKVCFKIPFLPEVRLSYKIPYPKIHTFNGQHYWEIGKRGYSPSVIRSLFKKYFIIRNEFIPFENQYHHFFILEKK